MMDDGGGAGSTGPDEGMQAALADLAAIDYGVGPSILVFCNDPTKRRTFEELITAAGGRVSAALGLEGALARIAQHAAPDGVLVEIGDSRPDLAEAIFDCLEQGARSQRFRSVAIIAPDLIDLAMARGGHRDVEILCDDVDSELAEAIAALVSPRGLSLSDVSADAAPVKLRELREQVGRIARTLAALSRNQRGEGEGAIELAPGAAEGPALEDAGQLDATALRMMIRARRLRDQFFGGEIFADPAWDMLLDLMAARLEGQTVAVSSLCIAAAVPPTTALRWIKTMTDLGLFVRVADPKDRRRVFIELDSRAVQAMQGYFGAMRRLALHGAPPAP